MKCEHHYCRCIRAAELASIYDRTGRGEYLRQAIGVHEQFDCRMPAEPVKACNESNGGSRNATPRTR